MKLFVVMQQWYSDCEPVSVWSSEELAEAEVQRLTSVRQAYKYYYDHFEFELDKS